MGYSETLVNLSRRDQPAVHGSDQSAEPGRDLAALIANSAQMPSKVLLPVVPGVSVPTALPPCPGLRAEPSRSYQAFVNRTAPAG